MGDQLLNSFKEITVEKPVDKIINQIKYLLSTGQLQPGDRLPPERLLSERFGIGRTYVRDAIKKLEFYGILKTLPQSGTVVAGFGVAALEGLITDVLQLEGTDFYSLVETRVMLETNSAALAALRRTDDDIASLSLALSTYEKAVKEGKPAVEEDLLFHLKIAEASKNSVLKSLMLIVTPDILTYFKENNVCGGDKPKSALEDHYNIMDYIVKGDADKAEHSMRLHLNDIFDFANNNLNDCANDAEKE